MRKEKTSFIKFVTLSLLPLLAAYLLNKGILALYGAEEGVAFSNYSYSLYGLAKGGAYWAQIFEDHPELLAMTNSEQTRLAYKLAFQLIVDQPGLFLSGTAHELKVFFSEAYNGIWSFVNLQPLQAAEKSLPVKLVHIGLYALSLIGILHYIKKPKCPYSAFSIFAFIGFLLSVPLAPPSHAYGLRVFAANIWVLGLLPALGLEAIIPEKWKNIHQNNSDLLYPGQADVWVFTGLILSLIFLGPTISLQFGEKENILLQETAICPVEEDLVLLSYHSQSLVLIEREDTFFLDGRSRYHQGRFISNLHNIAELGYIEEFGMFSSPFVILPGFQLEQGELALLVTQPDQLPVEAGNFTVCAKRMGELNVYELTTWLSLLEEY